MRWRRARLVLQDLDDAIVPDGPRQPGPSEPTTCWADGPTGAQAGAHRPRVTGAAPGAAPEATAKPGEDRRLRYTSGHGYGNGGTPPGHADPKGPSHPDPTPRPIGQADRSQVRGDLIAPMHLDVIGAGPAYTDRPGATGASYLLRAR